MKILFIAADTNKIGGIEKYNREFMGALQEAEADIFLFRFTVSAYFRNYFLFLEFFWNPSEKSRISSVLRISRLLQSVIL